MALKCKIFNHRVEL